MTIMFDHCPHKAKILNFQMYCTFRIYKPQNKAPKSRFQHLINIRPEILTRKTGRILDKIIICNIINAEYFTFLISSISSPYCRKMDEYFCSIFNLGMFSLSNLKY